MEIKIYKLAKHQIKSLIIDAVMQAAHESGRNAYIMSQRDVPVITGELKRSGNIITLPNGLLIQYTKIYASVVERGMKPGRINVKSYVTKNGVLVREHSYYQKGRKPNPFIERALRWFFKDKIGTTTFFQFNFTKALKRNFPGKTIIKL